MSKVVACNKCGETVQDDPVEALGAIHNNADGDSSSCGGQFVEMSEDEAETLTERNLTDITFGTKEK
jgi:hypothetical protein